MCNLMCGVCTVLTLSHLHWHRGSTVKAVRSGFTVVVSYITLYLVSLSISFISILLLYQLEWQLQQFLNSDSFAAVVQALVTSRLDYCNRMVGLECYCEMLMGVHYWQCIAPGLKELCWLPIWWWTHFKVLLLMCKLMGPVYLQKALPCISLPSHSVLGRDVLSSATSSQGLTYIHYKEGLWCGSSQSYQYLGSFLKHVCSPRFALRVIQLHWSIHLT